VLSKNVLDGISGQVERLHVLEVEDAHIINIRVQVCMQQEAERERERERERKD
jgi:hypothetical protein